MCLRERAMETPPRRRRKSRAQLLKQRALVPLPLLLLGLPLLELPLRCRHHVADVPDTKTFPEVVLPSLGHEVDLVAQVDE